MTVSELKNILKDVPDEYEVRLEFIDGYDEDDCAEWNNTTLTVQVANEYKEVYFSPKY